MKKRIFSALIALIMLISSFAPVSTFAIPGEDFKYMPYTDEDGYYYRTFDLEKKSFNTNWESIVYYVATEIQACKKTIVFDFASSEIEFMYTYTTKINNSQGAKDYLYSTLINDVTDLIGSEGYLIGHYNITVYNSDIDTPFNNSIPRYYPFTVTLSSISYSETDIPAYPCYNSTNGKYYRISDGIPLAFNTDYEAMIEYIQNAMINRRNSVSYYFATTDSKYKYTRADYSSDSSEVCERFARDVLTDVFKKDSDKPTKAACGDYLFKSIKFIGTHGYSSYLSAGDNPIEGNQRYYTFKLTFNNICYFTTTEQEDVIKEYCTQFSNRYIKSNATEYEKVKTIFDFVVRNTKYDWEVFNDREKYPFNSKRYTIAHSAYGAILGNLEENDQYDFMSKNTVSGQKVIEKADQGLAVCEGYSKLFYYLCVMNGIPCRIVDGDYVEESGKESDPHEWNYVWLDDGCGDGYKWFEVDTTFAAQKSFKDVDMNDYNYFLCGREESVDFGYKNHQQPFHIDDTSIEDANVIYDYWGDNGDSTYISSAKNYQFKKLDFSKIDALDCGYIVRRSTEYEGDTDVKVALIHSTKDGQYIININDDGTVLPTDVHGFIYNGQPQSVYEVFIPYLDMREYDAGSATNYVDAGTYYLTIKGANNTSAEVSFNILPMDLDNSHEGNYEDETINVQDSAVYTGNIIVPETHIVDGYKNVLEEGRDFRIDAYSDSQHTKLTEIKEIGTYYIDINYEVGNNYSGHYYLTFEVGKVSMNQLDVDDFEFPYLPESMRIQNKIYSPVDLYKAGSMKMTIGDHNVLVDKDYSVSSSGGLSWDESGILTLTGLSTSGVIASGTTKTIKYNISKKYDISDLDGKYADSGTTNIYTYTGKAWKPVRFDHLDGYLEQGVDYVIDSYSNNVNAGEASVKIKGIKGCSGSATMHFHINKASITNCVITPENGKISSVTYYGKDLVKGTDYTEKMETTSTGYRIVLTGINNFGGTYTINFSGTLVKPTSTGNYAKLSATKYTYNGKAQKPSVVMYNKSKKAISSIYYNVSYSSNTKVGTGKAKVVFQNGYSGTMTYDFAINPKNTSLSSLSAAKKAFTVKWKKYTTQTTGYQIQYSTSSKFSSAKTVTVSKNTTTSKKITGLKAKKTYYVRIRTYKTVSGKKYYSSWSSSKKIKTK